MKFELDFQKHRSRYNVQTNIGFLENSENYDLAI